jgi:hypothetical protein
VSEYDNEFERKIKEMQLEQAGQVFGAMCADALGSSPIAVKFCDDDFSKVFKTVVAKKSSS